jgi:hypothetical protein
MVLNCLSPAMAKGSVVAGVPVPLPVKTWPGMLVPSDQTWTKRPWVGIAATALPPPGLAIAPVSGVGWAIAPLVRNVVVPSALPRPAAGHDGIDLTLA